MIIDFSHSFSYLTEGLTETYQQTNWPVIAGGARLGANDLSVARFPPLTWSMEACLFHSGIFLMIFFFGVLQSNHIASSVPALSNLFFPVQYNSWISQTGLKKEITVPDNNDDNAVYYGRRARLPVFVPC